MTREEFSALVARLQAVSEQHPRAYNFRVAALTVLGYAYLLGVLAVSVLITLAVIGLIIVKPNAGTIKLGLIVGIATGGLSIVLAKALWVRLAPPEGLEITRADAPEIFSLLDKLRKKFNGPRFHHVLLTNDYNAFVSQVPRLGILGWQCNYLALGLPMMESLPVEEFEAVLAHEFGHLSGNHGRFSGWIYRVRATWERTFEEMAKTQQSGDAVLRKFIQWFWPKFNAHAFVLARANEYEADRCSAEFSGKQAAASLLMRINVHGAFLDEKFWSGVIKRTATEEKPPTGIYREMAKALQAPMDPADTTRWLKIAFNLETNVASTHPCLKDRLRSLGALPESVLRGEVPACVPPISKSAASHFLGAKHDFYSDKLSAEWIAYVTPLWEQRRKELTDIDKELAEASKPDAAVPQTEHLWRRARAMMDRDGDDAALPIVEEILAIDPNHALANLVRGRIYLEKDQAEGIPFIDRAISKDELFTKAGCELLYGFYARAGQKEKLPALEDRIEKFDERLQADQIERNNLSMLDVYHPYELPAEKLEVLKKVFTEEKQVYKVWVAQKQLNQFPQHPHVIFAVHLKVAWWIPSSESANGALTQRLVNKMDPGVGFIVFVEDDKDNPILRKVASTAKRPIYQRAES